MGVAELGSAVGDALGEAVGDRDGLAEGTSVGLYVGREEGLNEGLADPTAIMSKPASVLRFAPSANKDRTDVRAITVKRIITSSGVFGLWRRGFGNRKEKKKR